MSPERAAYLAAVEAWKTADRSDSLGMRDVSARLLAAEVAFERTAEGRTFFSSPLAPVGVVETSSLAGETPVGPSDADFDRFELEVGLRRSRPAAPSTAAGAAGGVSDVQLDAFERSLGLK